MAVDGAEEEVDRVEEGPGRREAMGTRAGEKGKRRRGEVGLVGLQR